MMKMLLECSLNGQIDSCLVEVMIIFFNITEIFIEMKNVCAKILILFEVLSER